MLIYSASDLKSRRVEVLEAAQRSQAIVRAVDGTALVMTRLDGVERSRAVAHWSLLLHRSQSQPVSGELKWLKHLDADDQEECLQELWDAVESLDAGTLEPVDVGEILEGWRAAALSLADSQRREILLGEVGLSDFVEAGRPE